MKRHTFWTPLGTVSAAFVLALLGIILLGLACGEGKTAKNGTVTMPVIEASSVATLSPSPSVGTDDDNGLEEPLPTGNNLRERERERENLSPVNEGDSPRASPTVILPVLEITEIFIASDSSSPADRERADYIVSGTGAASDFYRVVTAAISDAPTGGALKIKFAEGLYCNGTRSGVHLPSNTTIEATPGVTFTIKDYAGAQACIFTASNASNIQIIGGARFDGNALGQGSGTPTAEMICNGIDFTNVTASKVDAYFENWSGRNVMLRGDCSVDITQRQWIGKDYDLNDYLNLYDPPKFIATPTVVLSECDSLSGWEAINGTLAVDTQYAWSGTSALKLTQTGAANSYARAEYTLSSPTDFSNRFLRLRVYFDETQLDSNGFYLIIRFHSARSGDGFLQWTARIQNLTMSQWQTLNIGKVQLSVNSTSNWPEDYWTDINKISIGIRRTVTGGAVGWFDKIELVEELKTAGIVTFRFDDNLTSQYLYAAPELAKYGWGGVAATNICNLRASPNRLSVDELRALQEEYGWDIVSHTYCHEMGTQVSIGKWVDALEDAQQWLLANGFESGAMFFRAPFRKTYYPAYSAKANELYLYKEEPPLPNVMGGMPSLSHTLSQRFDLRPLPYDLDSFEQDVAIGDDKNVSLEEFRWICRYAHQYGYHFTMLFHDVTPGLVASYAQIAYEEGLDCMTLSQLYDFLTVP